MNKGLWFIELFEDDLTPGSATLSPVRGQFNDTGLAREQVRDFSDAAPDFTHYPPPATSHGTVPTRETLRILVTDRKRSEDTLYTRLPRVQTSLKAMR